jgi:acetyl esterase/lipase
MGARTEGQLESIPVAAVSGLKVISVDYRQGPEHRFPAASEDVAAVYRQLLTQYEPEHIGIFGCSAGGLLTAQALAWFDQHGLPMPGAVGIFCAGAGQFGLGDSTAIAALFGSDTGGKKTPEYFDGADWQSPLVNPLLDSSLMARFPPTLLISSTRDFAMSATLATHQQLVALEKVSELHIYEGLIHYFFADTELTESQQAFAVMSRFFHQHLNRATPAIALSSEQ